MKRSPPTLLAVCLLAAHAAAQQNASLDWRHYAGDDGSRKYSPVADITRENVKALGIAWRWPSPDNAIVEANPLARPGQYQDTPLMIDGVLYTVTSLGQVAALDAGTGRTLWLHDPGSWKTGRPPNLGFVHRGLAYWTDGTAARLFLGTGDAYLLAIDAKTGKPADGFGENGKVDLASAIPNAMRATAERPGNYGVSSAPLVCRDVVVVGSSIQDGPPRKEAPRGDIRGFDARTGELRWTFHSVPQPGEFGHDTWENDAWAYSGGTNVWSLMTADQELGYLYLPFGTPTNDWYGGHRLGSNLFAESLVCLDAKTGRRVWHFQAVHHGLWDYDLPAAPILTDIVVNGRAIRAVAQVSKQGFTYVFDRRTGEPVWPIEERPVPQSSVPGERTSPTQPFPTKPPPFERQGVSDEDVIDFTPELRKQALELVNKFDRGPLFTPPSERGAIQLPGWAGGADWGGAAFDPETGILYVPSFTSPIVVRMAPGDRARTNFRYVRQPPMALPTLAGLRLIKPPYSRVTAIDLNKGEHVWMSPVGDGPRDHPLLTHLNLGPLGDDARGNAIVTRTLLFVTLGGGGLRSGETAVAVEGAPQVRYEPRDQPRLYAVDKATGALVWQVDLPAGPAASPMTYRHGGRQYIVVAAGRGANAELIALALPGSGS